jgi:hypothetical protein
VYVTVVPAQTGLAEGETDTLTGSNGLTDMFTTEDVAGLPEGHVAFDVITQVTASLLTGI